MGNVTVQFFINLYSGIKTPAANMYILSHTLLDLNYRFWEVNSGPLAPKARIIPQSQVHDCISVISGRVLYFPLKPFVIVAARSWKSASMWEVLVLLSDVFRLNQTLELVFWWNKSNTSDAKEKVCLPCSLCLLWTPKYWNS